MSNEIPKGPGIWLPIAQYEALMVAVKACEGIDTFAWSSCTADCAEARDNAMLRIIACRKARAALRAAGILEEE